MSEERKKEKVDIQVDEYFEKYKPQMKCLEKSVLAKVKSLDTYDYWTLGKQLESWDTFVEMCEGSVNQLGRIPNIAHDIITAVHGASILPIIASTQPIEEESGMVYFKTIRSEETRGSQTAQDVVMDPRTGVVTPQGYASGWIEGEEGAVTSATVLSYSFTTAVFPVKAQSLYIYVEGVPTVEGQDFGPSEAPADPNIGRIWGNGIS